MSKRDKLLERLADSKYDHDHRYKELAALLIHLGYSVRHRGSSHVKFRLRGRPMLHTIVLVKQEIVSTYQVEQVRDELRFQGFLK